MSTKERALRRAETSSGIELKTVYRPEELAEPRSFVRRVLDGLKIMLVGSEDDIAKLVGKPVAHETRSQSRGGRRPARGR